MTELEAIEKAAAVFNLNGTIQWHHDKRNGHTYAIDISFNREDLLETIHRFDQPVTFMIGESTLHPNDNYNKKTGRTVIASKMKPTMLRLNYVYKEPVPVGVKSDKLFIEFRDEDTGINYTFRVNSHSEKPHFIKASTY